MADPIGRGSDAGDLDARWAAARLAHAATALSRLQHDLRNMLAPAMLAAERLQTSDVPTVKRAGDVTLRSAERANAAISATLLLLRAGLPRPNRNAVRLATALGEAVSVVPSNVTCDNRVAGDPFVEATPGHLEAALAAVFETVVAAGARRLEVTLDPDPRRVGVTITHDGAALPASDTPVDRGSWPHLAIAQEYVLAVEGRLATGGTTVRVELIAAPGG